MKNKKRLTISSIYWFYLAAGLIIVSGVIFLSQMTREARALSWTVITLESGAAFGEYVDIKINSLGNPRISSFDSANEDLLYSFCDSDCTSALNWTTVSLDTVNTVGKNTSLALDSSNNPRISYQDNNNSDLKYTSCDASCGTPGNWTGTTIDNAGIGLVATSLTLNSLDNPRIAYQDTLNSNLMYAEYTGSGTEISCDDNNWTCSDIDTDDAGYFLSLALDSSNNPRISYKGTIDADLRYAQFVGGGGGSGCANPDWTCITVDSSVTGEFTSLKINGSDNPRLSYYDAAAGGLYYAFCDSTCTSALNWTTVVVHSGVSIGQYTSLELDSSNNPRISYLDGTAGDVKYASCDTSCGTAENWTKESIDTGTAYTALALDSSDDPHVAFTSSLSYATASAGGGGGGDDATTTVTVSNEAPEASGVVFNTTGGTSTGASDGTPTDVSLTENTTTTVYCAGIVTDNNGCGDIQSAIAWLYRVGGSGTLAAADCDADLEADNDNCYKATNCAVDTAVNSCGGASDFTASYKCSVSTQYFAESTDAGSYQEGILTGEGNDDDANWKCTLVPSDESTGTSAESATGKEVNTLTALNVAASFSYGSLALGANTGATNQTTLVTNTGNVGLDTELSGTAMTCTTGSIAVGNQEYANATFTWGVGGTDLSGLATELDLDAERTNAAASTDPTKDIYWGLGIPATGAEGSCSGTNTVTALEDTNCGYTTCD